MIEVGCKNERREDVTFEKVVHNSGASKLRCRLANLDYRHADGSQVVVGTRELVAIIVVARELREYERKYTPPT